jgi:hypothetical protein
VPGAGGEGAFAVADLDQVAEGVVGLVGVRLVPVVAAGQRDGFEVDGELAAAGQERIQVPYPPGGPGSSSWVRAQGPSRLPGGGGLSCRVFRVFLAGLAQPWPIAYPLGSVMVMHHGAKLQLPLMGIYNPGEDKAVIACMLVTHGPSAWEAERRSPSEHLDVPRVRRVLAPVLGGC